MATTADEGQTLGEADLANDDDLTALEEQVMAQFEARDSDPEPEADEGSPEAPEPAMEGADDESPQEPPSPIEQEEADSSPSPPPSEEAGQPPADAAPPPPAEIDEPDDDGPLVYEIDGQDYSEDTIRTGLALNDWASKLDEDGMRTVDAALSGEYTLIHNSEIPKIQEFFSAVQEGRVAEDGSPINTTDPDEDDYVDPEVAQLRQQVADLQGRQQYADYQQQVVDQTGQINAAEDQFQQAKGYDADRMEYLADFIMDNGLLNPEQHGGDWGKAATKAFEVADAANPIAPPAAPQPPVPDTPPAAAASALAGTGAATGVEDPPPPQTDDDAMTQMIAQAIANGGDLPR